MKFLKSILPYIIIIIVVVLIRTFLISPGRVNGESMEDTLFNGEIVIVNKIALRTKGINRFDIVVIDYEGERLIKRVIGLPGEEVKYADNKLYIDGKEVTTNLEFMETDDFSHTVEKGSYFVMGDNRIVSKDSRVLGAIPKKAIKGKVNLVILPFKRFGTVQ